MVSSATIAAKAPGRRGLKPGQRHAGQFGNPGRDPVSAAKKKAEVAASDIKRGFVAACRDMGPLMQAKLRAIIESPKSSESAVLRAIEIAAAYGFGKPVSVVDVNVTHKPRTAAELTDEEIRAFLGGAPLRSPVLIEDQRGRNVFDAEGRLLDFSAEPMSVNQVIDGG
jgi:hypothetical protein